MRRDFLPAPGQLTDRVRIERRTLTPMPEGGLEAVYLPLGNAWARVRTLSNRFGLLDEQRAAAASHAVVLRWRNDVEAGDRIVYRGRRLEVTGTADLNGRRAYLSLTCAEQGHAS